MEKIIAESPNKRIFSDGDRCYKVFIDGYSKSAILNEALNHGLVEETGLNIPGLLEITTINGSWAIVTKYIEGRTMEELFNDPSENEDDLIKRFIEIQIDVQSKRCPLLTKHRDKMNRKISETDLSATLRYDLHNRIESKPRHNYLCHGDFNPSNIIISNDNIPFIIDWSHATQGNREADSARSYLLFLLGNQKERARKYLTMYSEMTGSSKQDILEWLPILAASQSVKGIRNQKDFLHSLIYLNSKELETLDEQL